MNEKGCEIKLVLKKAEKEIVHTLKEYDFPDSLYQDHWENAEAFGIVGDKGELLACVEACGCTKGFVAKDDSNTIVDKIVAADLIVFASPIYWWGVTAQIKTIIDKCYCKGAFLKNKKIGLILCAGAPADDEEYSLIKRQFELISEYLCWDMEFFKAFFAVERTSLAGNQEALDEMKALGRNYCG